MRPKIACKNLNKYPLTFSSRLFCSYKQHDIVHSKMAVFNSHFSKLNTFFVAKIVQVSLFVPLAGFV